MRTLLAILLLPFLRDDPVLVAARDRGFPGLTREKEGRWTGPFFFVALADPQFGMMTDPEQERKNAEAAVAHINRLKPRFVAVLGDLTHAVPGEKGHEEQVAEFKEVFSKVDRGIPLLLLPGNHDLAKKATPAALAAWRKSYGDDYYSFWAGGVQGLVLNSHLYWNPAEAPEEQARQEEWLAERLAAARRDPPKHLIVFQHQPWFMKTPDDADVYDVIPKARRVPALAALKDAGVRTVFAGHYHGNVRARDGDLEIVVVGPLGKALRKDPSGLLIVEVRADRLRHAYYGLDAVPETVCLEP
jgi:3',5'-cyclic AMP phosphodiesterase CpdA